MPSLKQSDNPISTATVIIVLTAILSSVAFGEDLKFCPGGKVTDRSQLAKLKDCDVIEGHLIITTIFNSTQGWQDFGSLKVREITDFLVIYMVDHLRSLNNLFPNLSVIRGHKLYNSYALIVVSNQHLEELKLNNLTAILYGSVFIDENNVLNGYVNKIDWYRITYWNSQKCSHANIIQKSDNPSNCSKSCKFRDKALDNNTGNFDEYCWSADACQKNYQLNLTYTATGELCHDQCIGGCFAAGSDEACVACKGFRVRSGNKCHTSCGSLYELDNYVCVTDLECDNLGNKQIQMLVNTPHGVDVKKQCVKECPNDYQEVEIKDSKIICQKCIAGGCAKKCKGGLIDSISKAQKYQECTLVEGYLEIILFGANLTAELQKYLGNIEVVSWYVRVFKSVALPNLQFFRKLRSIEGHKLWNGNYSLIINDNDELQELWHNDEFTLQKGDALFYANPKLCPQIIEKLLSKNKWQEKFPGLNGNKKQCFVNNKLELLFSPIDEGKGVMKVQILASSFGDEVRLRMAGFHVYYKLSDSEKLPSQDDKLLMGQSSNSIPSTWSVHFQDYIDKSSKYVEAVITGLEPSRNYSFYIETLTVNNDNNFGSFQSPQFNATTLPYYPSEPTNVTYSGSKNYTQVRWSPPLETNGEIHHYEISVEPYEREQNTANLCEIQDHFKNGSFQKIPEVFADGSTVTPAMQPTSSSKCFFEAQSSVDRLKAEKEAADNLKITISNVLFYSRVKRDATLTDDEGSRIMLTGSSKSGIQKRLFPKKAQEKNILKSQLISLQDLESVESAIQQGNWWEYFENLNLTAEESCSILKKFYEKYSNFPPNPLFMQICWKLEEATNPASDDDDDIIIVIAENYGGSYNMTNLKANNSYLVKVKACHKPTGRTPLCTRGCKCSNETYIVVHALHDEGDVRVQNLAIVPDEGDLVTVKWLPPKISLGNNLVYNIKVKGPDGLRIFCEISSFKTLNVSTSGNYFINVTPFSDTWPLNFSTPTEIQYSFNNAAIMSEYTKKRNMSIIYAACFFGAISLISCFCVYIFCKGKKTEISLSNFIENPGYIIMHPSIKEYLYDKIPFEKLYSKKDFKRTGLAGLGKFGIVYKGALRVIDGTNKKKYIPVAAKQLINPLFIDIENKKHVRVNEGKDQGSKYNEPRNQNEEYEASNQDNELMNPMQINNQEIELTKQLIDEASLMLTLKSFHLVRTYGVMSENYELSIIMELMTTENLSTYLKKQKRWGSANNLISLEQVIKFGIQIADGMTYLSEKGVVHRDLAARNCLIDSHLNVKVSDFGMARVMQDNIYISTGENKPVPVRWMPPEYFKEEKFVTNSDVYSFGILLWEIVNLGELPYREVKVESRVQFKVVGGVTLLQSIPRWVPPQLKVLIGSCWHYMPEDRPCFRAIVKQLLGFTSNNFKRDFEKASFYHCGDQPEYKPEESYYPVPPVDEDDADPSTPLTTPTAETAFTDLNISDYARHDELPIPILRSILNPFHSLRDFWNKPRKRDRYSIDFSQLPFSFSTRESRNPKHDTVNLRSNKPDVLPVTSMTNPEDSRRKIEFP